MFTRCLFCHKPFPENECLGHVPWGRRVAYDPERGRLWLVCESCHRWNLVPLEDRTEALWELERIARDGAIPVAHTANVTLLHAPPLALVRVGNAGLAEQAWWRYGKELRKRRSAFQSTGSKLTALTYGTMAFLSEVVGFTDLEWDITWDDTPMADILRWRRFGWAAWWGSVECPYCHSVLRTLRFDVSWWIYPLWQEDGRLALGVPCPRCDPWTPEKVYTLEGSQAENVLRRVLAYQHISGAGERSIMDAVREIEEAGSVGEFARHLTRQRLSLWKMGTTRSMALEIAVNEAVEDRMLDLEVRALEQVWKEEETLARIIDEELTPRRRLERHLRRLPPAVRPRWIRPEGSPAGRP